MNNRTFKVIIFLVALLFLNIEAAQAGLIHRVKMYIVHEFTDYQLVYFAGALFVCSFLLYVMLTPVSIGKERRRWFTQVDVPTSRDFSSRKMAVKRISEILKPLDESLSKG